MQIEIDNSLNFASFHMYSPTKPFNLLNFDLLNKYNLDDENSDSESPKSSLIKKKSSPKINILFPHEGGLKNEQIGVDEEKKDGRMEISLDASPLLESQGGMLITPKMETSGNLKVFLCFFIDFYLFFIDFY